MIGVLSDGELPEADPEAYTSGRGVLDPRWLSFMAAWFMLHSAH